MEDLKNCPVCNSSQFDSFLTCTDFTVSRETFNIVTCKQCGFKFTNPRPSPGEIGKYYESEDYVSHSNTKRGLINKLYHFVKKSAIKGKFRLISELDTESQELLDIGCGTGDFIGFMQKNGWRVKGVEPNEKARDLGIKNHSIDVIREEDLKVLNNASFSIITMWHVLEHVHHLTQRVTEINALLKNGGYAIIAVPNYTAWDAKYYREFWAAYDVPRHLYHFSPAIIKTLFEKHNLKHVKSIPMKMDSFYVSMLSEKYKKSSLGLIRAFFSGLTSNLKAGNDAEKYSSVIYVFRKK